MIYPGWMKEPDIHGVPFHVTAIKAKLARNIDSTIPDMVDEIGCGFEDLIPASETGTRSRGTHLRHTHHPQVGLRSLLLRLSRRFWPESIIAYSLVKHYVSYQIKLRKRRQRLTSVRPQRETS